MLKNSARILSWTMFTILTALLLTGCFLDGGGDNPAPPQELVYSGNTNSAVITLENAATLVGNVLYGGEAGTNIPAAVMLTEETNARSAGAVVQSELLHSISQNIEDSIFKNNTSLPDLAVSVDLNEPLECDSGSGNIAGTLNDSTFTGTLTVTYINCLYDGVTYNGTGTFRVDAIYLDINEITDATMNFTLMSISSVEFTGSISGSIRIQKYIYNNTEIITLNYITKDDKSGKMYKFEDVVIKAVYDYIFYPSTKVVTYTGTPARVYDSLHGYVDVDTYLPLTFSSAMLAYPDVSGEMIFTGAAGSSIWLLVLSGEECLLELDIDGLPGYEISRVLSWDELALSVNTDLTNPDSDKILEVPFGDSWQGFTSSGYWAQTFMLQEAATAERLTMYIANTSGINFRILLTEVEKTSEFHPGNILYESNTISISQVDDLTPVTVNLGGINLNAGQTYAWILDGYVEYDGTDKSAVIATPKPGYNYDGGFLAVLSDPTHTGTRDELFAERWFEDLGFDMSFILEYK